jgi:UDP-N-acetylglucosamine acyltransferase
MAEQTIIHPSAVVDPSAELGKGVEIGPFCFIGKQVRIGDNNILLDRVHVGDYTIMGSGNKLFTGAVVGSEPQDLKFCGEKSLTRIGDNNRIREFATINRGTGEGGETVLGNDNLIMINSHVAHDCILKDHVIMANSAALAGHVLVDSGAIINGLAGVAQFIRIGRLAFVGGLSAVRTDILPFMKYSGNPCKSHGVNTVGLKRNGVSDETISIVKKAYRVIVRSKMSQDDAIGSLRQEYPDVQEIKNITEFIENSEHGICR